jgi:hypothetical protein|uniref:Uncharacterized protein n=1 Tax=Zea mays TaxID=4577 RepID=A0A804RCI6_MAIZE
MRCDAVDDRIVRTYVRTDTVGTDLGLELLVVGEEGVVVGLDGVELAPQRVVVLLQLLRLPPRAPVLEPDGHLPRLQAQRARQLQLALRLQLVPELEVLLQRPHLLHVQPPLLLPGPDGLQGAVVRHLVLVRRAAARLLASDADVVRAAVHRRALPQHWRHTCTHQPQAPAHVSGPADGSIGLGVGGC